VEPVYGSVIAVSRTLFAAQGLQFTLSGTEHIPREGGALLVMNHVGFFDFTYAGLAARPAKRYVRFMAKAEVFAHPIAGPLMRGMHHIPVDRMAGTGSFTTATEALRAGEVVGVFPEATISSSFELKQFKSGAARMALDAGVPLYPPSSGARSGSGPSAGPNISGARGRRSRSTSERRWPPRAVRWS